MRLERKGFSRTFTNDVYHVEKRLKEHDDNLYVMYNPNICQWLIVDERNDSIVMKIPQIGFEELDARVVNHIKQIDVMNGYNVVDVIEREEALRDRELKRQQEDLAYNMAKDIKHGVQQAHDYGRDKYTSKYVQAV